MNISKIKHLLEHNKYMFLLVPYIRKSRFVSFLHFIKNQKEKKNNVEARMRFIDFVEKQHKDDFIKLRTILADDESKRVLDAVIEYRKTWNYKIIKDIKSEAQYFPDDIMQFDSQEVWIDGGAYVGDTIIDYMRCFCRRVQKNDVVWGGGYSKIYAWEPDEQNVRSMRKNLAKYKNITIIPKGLWNEKSEICFKEQGNAGSRIEEEALEGKYTVQVDSIDNVHKDEKITFIKMDIEGAEMQALKGAESTIKKYKPKLAICIYHEPEHLYSIAFLIKSFVPQYKLYIRHHTDTYAETVLYAVYNESVSACSKRN